MTLELGPIGLFSICFGPNQILKFCFVKGINMTKQINDSNRKTKQNEFNQMVTNQMNHDLPKKINILENC